MFDIKSDIAATKYQRYLLRLMEVFERRMRPTYFSLLQKTFSKAADNLEHGNPNILPIINEHQKELRQKLNKDYLNILAYFGTFTFDQFKKTYEKSIQIPEKKSMEDAYWEEVKKWANMSALSKSKMISDTTKKMIHFVIQRGMEEGLSNQDLIKQLRTGKEPLNRVRAARIVRTETHGAANKATHSAVKSTGYSQKKIWRATLDDRVRGARSKDRFNHLYANKQVQSMNDFFIVSRQKLMYPGDHSLGASAGNVVNCRCVLTYRTLRSPGN